MSLISSVESVLQQLETLYHIKFNRALFQYELGDITQSPAHRLFHQCNCCSHNAAHLAFTMFKAFPYSNDYKGRGGAPIIPGTYAIHGNRNDETQKKEIVNLFAQYYPGESKYSTGVDSESKRLEYLKNCFQKYLVTELSQKDEKGKELETYAAPLLMGCGAACGNIEEYHALWTWFITEVKKKQPNTTLTFYIYDKKQQSKRKQEINIINETKKTERRMTTIEKFFKRQKLNTEIA